MRKFVLVLSAILILPSCIATASQSREEYLASRIDIPKRYAQAIMNGKIMRGMSQEDVNAAWGRPSSIRNSSWGDTWTYQQYLGRTLGSNYSFVYFAADGTVRDWSAE